MLQFSRTLSGITGKESSPYRVISQPARKKSLQRGKIELN